MIINKLFEGCDVETGVDYLEHKEHFDALGGTVVYTGTIDAYYQCLVLLIIHRIVSFHAFFPVCRILSGDDGLRLSAKLKVLVLDYAGIRSLTVCVVDHRNTLMILLV